MEHSWREPKATWELPDLYQFGFKEYRQEVVPKLEALCLNLSEHYRNTTSHAFST